MAEILFDQDGTRIVLLNRKFDHNGRDQQELRLRCTKDGAMLFHFFQSSEPKNYGLSTTEADVFCEEWLAYRAKQKAEEQTERDRLQAMVQTAYQIVAEQPAIQIKLLEVHGEPAWRVSVPEIDWGHHGQVSSPYELLDLTRTALAAYQRHLDWQAHKATA